MSPGPEDRDHRHRDDFEREEEEELELEGEEDYDDLIGGQIDNSATGGAAEAVRAQRASAEIDLQEPEEMFEVLEERAFLNAPGAAEATRDRSTADEPDDEPPPPLAAPDDDDDEPAYALPGGESWSAGQAPAPTEPLVGSSDWVDD